MEMDQAVEIDIPQHIYDQVVKVAQLESPRTGVPLEVVIAETLKVIREVIAESKAQ